ncbi:CBS domain-containing protein [Nanoarchaeota archaeon]
MISECFLVEPFTCKDSDTVSEVAKKLKQYTQRHIYVVDDNDKPVGIISITDIIDKIIIPAKNVADFKAKDVMHTEIIVFEDNDRLKKAYKLMVDKGVVSCAITENNKMIGMLTLKEAIKHITNPEKL